VIDVLVDFLKHAARPVSVEFLTAVLAVGVVLAFLKRTQRTARWYFLSVLAFYWIGASPACAERLVRWQGGGYRPLAAASEARGARVVVVLGAGNHTIRSGDLALNEIPMLAALRVIEGARLYTLLDHPTIIVSGGTTSRDTGARSEADAMRAAIVRLGVPPDHVALEDESKNTREEAIIVARMVADRPRQPIVLVTTPTHMRRALALFRAAGLDVVPSAAPFKPDHANEHWRWVPNDIGLWLLDTAVYDMAATWYYHLRGWPPG
jgi:uncharacterized SAM-binding protein YcdF (DUF218 family)